MTCDHCKGAVIAAVKEVPGVDSVSVDLATGRVKVQLAGSVDGGAVKAAIEEAGDRKSVV